MGSDLRDLSKMRFSQRALKAEIDEVQAGALQRIADSLEKMEKPFADQIKEIERLKSDNAYLYKRLAEERDKAEALSRSIASYRGHLTRLKNKKQ